jgi:hypothetical protein
MVLITHRDWGVKSNGTTRVDGWDNIEANYPKLRITQDVAAPLTPTAVLETFYPATQVAGTAPGTAQRFWTTPYRHFYVRFAVKLSSNWIGNQSTTNKLFHVWVGGNGVADGNRIFYRAVCAGTGRCDFQVALQGSPDARTRFPANLGSGTMTRGQWYTYEVEHILNTPGQANGVIRVWTDHVLTHQYLDVVNQSATENIGVRQLQWSPTYGGGGASPGVDQYIWLDHTYASGKP